VIVVHGVADQKPGETARSVVDLLVASGGGSAGASYQATSTTDFILSVRPLASEAGVSARADATPLAKGRSFKKAWRQSLTSDLRAGAVIDAPQAPRAAGARQEGVDGPDRGVALTRYLLAKHVENGASDEFYESTCIHVERTEGARTSPLSVYEMYWADLSRLSGALPRIVTELFTMVFRLSKLGRDTVDEACGWRLPPAKGPRRQGAWNLTARLQTLLDWLFANVLALLFAQLLLLVLVFVVLGITSSVGWKVLDHRYGLHAGVAVASAFVLLLVHGYHRRGAPPASRVAIPTLALAVICLAPLVLRNWFGHALMPWVSGLLLAGGVFALYDAGLRVADERFPFTRRVGWVVWLLLLAVVLVSAGYEVYTLRPLDWRTFDVGWHASIFGVEVLLLAIRTWWVVAGVLLILWFIAGCLAAREASFEARASLATGRLGLALSLATFLVLTMAIWAMLTTVIDVSAREVAYTPCVFKFDEAAAAAEAASEAAGKEQKPEAANPPASAPAGNACVVALQGTPGAANAASVAAGAARFKPSASSARWYLKDRYRNSTTLFSLLVLVLLVLFGYLVVVFLPSVIAELKLFVAGKGVYAARIVAAKSASIVAAGSVERARTYRLGRWLTVGFKGLDAVVFVLVGAGCLLGVVVAYIWGVDTVAYFWSVDTVALKKVQGALSNLTQVLLEPLVLTTAGIFALLSGLGGVLSRYLPPIRAPLDIALDVDNHFREFPRAAIPRARIFSRYAALLQHVTAQGHDRIVIVAHSQGTVITAELLRYLSIQESPVIDNTGTLAPHPQETSAKPPSLRLAGQPLPDIALLTLGCPLRQLYAARFPTLYRWILTRRGRVTGPLASDVGVSRWINAYCSGDYVGRWLWSDSATPESGDSLGRPMTDSVDAGPFGRTTAYDGLSPMPPAIEPFNSTREIELCLGFGAHTHYFEPEMHQVAWLVDHLVTYPDAATTPGPIRRRRDSVSRMGSVLRGLGVVLVAGALIDVVVRRTTNRGRIRHGHDPEPVS